MAVWLLDNDDHRFEWLCQGPDLSRTMSRVWEGRRGEGEGGGGSFFLLVIDFSLFFFFSFFFL